MWSWHLIDLSRYCECFASGIYCDGCNCVNCFNNVDNEAARREAVEATLERNPNAFRPKIASSPHGTRDSRVCRFNSSLTVDVLWHVLYFLCWGQFKMLYLLTRSANARHCPLSLFAFVLVHWGVLWKRDAFCVMIGGQFCVCDKFPFH